MKKILITGAAGVVGSKVVSQILLESFYEVTLLELKNKSITKKLNKYKKRINIVYGDATDPVLMEALVKDHDIIIHLSSAMPPVANYNNLSYSNNYKATENIVKCIKNNKNSNYLLFASCLSVYDHSKENEYGKNKGLEEELITTELRNYSIIRLPQVLSTKFISFNVYNAKLDTKIEVITENDAASIFLKALQNLEKMKRKTFEVSGGDKCITTYREYIRNVCKIYGISFSFIKNSLFSKKSNYLDNIVIDNALLSIFDYQQESFSDYYTNLKKDTKKRRVLNVIVGKLYVKFLKRGIDDKER